MTDQTAAPNAPPPTSGVPTVGARQLLATGRSGPGGNAGGLNAWLIALLTRNGPMVEALSPGIDAAGMAAELAARIAAGDRGPAMSESDLLARARAHASLRNRPAPSELDIAAVLLAAAGRAVQPATEIGRLRRAAPGTGMAATDSAAPAASAAPPWQPRAAKPTPTLDRFGRDLTLQAAEGRLGPVVGRARELARIVETLCRRQKRNPILLGAAGTGKTAIVEGLAQRIVAGDVPAALRGVRIVQLQPSTLVAGAGIVGEIETRLKGILEDARQDGIILFIDEVHAIVGTGGMRGTGDLASLLKPALARGDLACIAATTDEEYRRFIEDDAALERRFSPVVVDELNEAATLEVVKAHRDDLRRLRGVEVPDDVLAWLVDFGGEAMPNRHFPDKAVDLLEQCVANAVVAGRSSVERSTAEEVARGMVGVPLAIGGRLGELQATLTTRGLTDAATAAALAERLTVTMHGLDRRRHRANAVVAIGGPAADRAREIAETIATTLYGAPDRIITLDLGRMTAPHDVAMLVGAPPGYVGYSDRLPIHRIAASPWSVVLCQGAESAHAEVRELLADALETGAFVDGTGRRISIADTIFVLVVGGIDARRAIGFRIEPSAEAAGEAEPLVRPLDTTALQRQLGTRLAGLCDVLIGEVPRTASNGGAQRVLEQVAERFAQAGLVLEFEPSMAGWLVERAGRAGDLESVADRDLVPVLAGLLGDADGPRTVVVKPGPAGRPIVTPIRKGARR